jgi:hypothetical protein
MHRSSAPLDAKCLIFGREKFLHKKTAAQDDFIAFLGQRGGTPAHGTTFFALDQSSNGADGVASGLQRAATNACDG